MAIELMDSETKSKILSQAELGYRPIIICTGGFDPLHSGHIDYLKSAMRSGSFIAVGLNSDDWLLPKGMSRLVKILDLNTKIPLAYGNTHNYIQAKKKYNSTWVEPFSEKRLAIRCIVSQPGVLIRKECIDSVGGIDKKLSMAFDYDLWWRLYQKYGEFKYTTEYIAVNRVHRMTKTNLNRAQHYREAMAVVKKYHGKIPIKWYLYKVYSVYYRAIVNKIYTSS